MSSGVTNLLALVPWWGWLALALVIVITAYAAHWSAVRESRRRAVPPIVQGTSRIQKPDDDEWKRIRVLRWWGHVWVWVPLDICTGITDRSVDAGDAADEIAHVWRGRSAGDPTRLTFMGEWLIFHIRRGQRR